MIIAWTATSNAQLQSYYAGDGSFPGNWNVAGVAAAAVLAEFSVTFGFRFARRMPHLQFFRRP